MESGLYFCILHWHSGAQKTKRDLDATVYNLLLF